MNGIREDKKVGELKRRGLDIGIIVIDSVAMRAFYERVLDIPFLETVELPGHGVITKLSYGESVIKLLALDTRPAIADKYMEYRAMTGIRYFSLNVLDLRKVVEQCRETGAKIITDIVSPRPGILAAMVQDPEGNAVEIIQTT